MIRCSRPFLFFQRFLLFILSQFFRLFSLLLRSLLLHSGFFWLFLFFQLFQRFQILRCFKNLFLWFWLLFLFRWFCYLLSPFDFFLFSFIFLAFLTFLMFFPGVLLFGFLRFWSLWLTAGMFLIWGIIIIRRVPPIFIPFLFRFNSLLILNLTPQRFLLFCFGFVLASFELFQHLAMWP